MQSLSSLMPKISIKKPDKTQEWQTMALECIAKLVDGTKYKGSIFKCFKNDARTAQLSLLDANDARTAQLSLLDAVELGKLHSLYFLKCYSSLRKRV